MADTSKDQLVHLDIVDSIATFDATSPTSNFEIDLSLLFAAATPKAAVSARSPIRAAGAIRRLAWPKRIGEGERGDSQSDDPDATLDSPARAARWFGGAAGDGGGGARALHSPSDTDDWDDSCSSDGEQRGTDVLGVQRAVREGAGASRLRVPADAVDPLECAQLAITRTSGVGRTGRGTRGMGAALSSGPDTEAEDDDQPNARVTQSASASSGSANKPPQGGKTSSKIEPMSNTLKALVRAAEARQRLEAEEAASRKAATTAAPAGGAVGLAAKGHRQATVVCSALRPAVLLVHNPSPDAPILFKVSIGPGSSSADQLGGVEDSIGGSAAAAARSLVVHPPHGVLQPGERRRIAVLAAPPSITRRVRVQERAGTTSGTNEGGDSSSGAKGPLHFQTHPEYGAIYFSPTLLRVEFASGGKQGSGGVSFDDRHGNFDAVWARSRLLPQLRRSIVVRVAQIPRAVFAQVILKTLEERLARLTARVTATREYAAAARIRANADRRAVLAAPPSMRRLALACIPRGPGGTSEFFDPHTGLPNGRTTLLRALAIDAPLRNQKTKGHFLHGGSEVDGPVLASTSGDEASDTEESSSSSFAADVSHSAGHSHTTNLFARPNRHRAGDDAKPTHAQSKEARRLLKKKRAAAAALHKQSSYMLAHTLSTSLTVATELRRREMYPAMALLPTDVVMGAAASSAGAAAGPTSTGSVGDAPQQPPQRPSWQWHGGINVRNVVTYALTLNRKRRNETVAATAIFCTLPFLYVLAMAQWCSAFFALVRVHLAVAALAVVVGFVVGFGNGLPPAVTAFVYGANVTGAQ